MNKITGISLATVLILSGCGGGGGGDGSTPAAALPAATTVSGTAAKVNNGLWKILAGTAARAGLEGFLRR